MDKLLCTISEAAESTGVSRSFLYERLSDRSIRSVKAGRKRLIVVESLREWAASLPTYELNLAGVVRSAK